MGKIEDLRKKVEKDPKSRLFVSLADECAKAGKIDEAIKVLRAGIGRMPDYVSARAELGKLFMAKGMTAEAEAEFETVILKTPDNLLANRKLAEIYLKEKKLPEALARLSVVVKLNPDDAGAKDAVKKLKAKGIKEPAPKPTEAQKKRDEEDLLALAMGVEERPKPAPKPSKKDAFEEDLDKTMIDETPPRVAKAPAKEEEEDMFEEFASEFESPSGAEKTVAAETWVTSAEGAEETVADMGTAFERTTPDASMMEETVSEFIPPAETKKPADFAGTGLYAEELGESPAEAFTAETGEFEEIASVEKVRSPDETMGMEAAVATVSMAAPEETVEMEAPHAEETIGMQADATVGMETRAMEEAAGTEAAAVPEEFDFEGEADFLSVGASDYPVEESVITEEEEDFLSVGSSEPEESAPHYIEGGALDKTLVGVAPVQPSGEFLDEFPHEDFDFDDVAVSEDVARVDETEEEEISMGGGVSVEDRGSSEAVHEEEAVVEGIAPSEAWGGEVAETAIPEEAMEQGGAFEIAEEAPVMEEVPALAEAAPEEIPGTAEAIEAEEAEIIAEAVEAEAVEVEAIEVEAVEAEAIEVEAVEAEAIEAEEIFEEAVPVGALAVEEAVGLAPGAPDFRGLDKYVGQADYIKAIARLSALKDEFPEDRGVLQRSAELKGLLKTMGDAKRREIKIGLLTGFAEAARKRGNEFLGNS